jgi:hypothetical protein
MRQKNFSAFSGISLKSNNTIFPTYSLKFLSSIMMPKANEIKPIKIFDISSPEQHVASNDY